MNWWSGLEAICRLDEPLAGHTWYGLGGPARWFLTPRSEEELAAVLRRCAASAIPWRVLGRGANLLVRDAGVDAAVIALTAPAWVETWIDPPTVRVAAGADFTKLVKSTLSRGLLGLENLAGIPGSVGGIIRMNAGGRYGNIAQYVRSTRLMTPDGACASHPAGDLGFAYRTSGIGRNIVTEVTLELTPGNPDDGLARFRDIWNEKYATQPPVSAKSAGCIFKNPGGRSGEKLAAGKLIDDAGLKGTRLGGAEISPKHANFIVAHPGACSADVLNLIELARRRVHEQFGVALELEIEIW